MGIALGLSAGIFFSVAAILSRVGMRVRGRDDGLFMSILMNVLALGVLTIAEDLPRWDTAGIVALAAGGILGTFGGRATNLRAVRLIGPTRATAFLTGGPLVTAVLGWWLLDERLSALSGLGGLVVVLGLYLLVQAQSGGAVAAQPQSASLPEPDRAVGYVFAAMAPVLFGLAFVVRKWGLVQYPSAMAGAFVGAVAGMVVTTAGDLARRRLGRRLAENLRDVPWWFVGAGAATSAALISQFLAFEHLHAWVVSLLQATQVLWTLLLAAIFLRREERIDGRVALSVGLVALGVVAITVQT
jgi:drug/metabolite transporter (DMT)-like permease